MASDVQSSNTIYIAIPHTRVNKCTLVILFLISAYAKTALRILRVLILPCTRFSILQLYLALEQRQDGSGLDTVYFRSRSADSAVCDSALLLRNKCTPFNKCVFPYHLW